MYTKRIFLCNWLNICEVEGTGSWDVVATILFSAKKTCPLGPQNEKNNMHFHGNNLKIIGVIKKKKHYTMIISTET